MYVRYSEMSITYNLNYTKKRPPCRAASILNYLDYDRKLSKIPAATALPITPATFGPMACISK
ncbi:hypothetical protein SAMN05216323_100247 [Williamwhitmania taraxaci]|uniref:Uncharacterized protein n=1 Tax=Williamwhitmania taraxaci TaxID=1640674 RepID=A0A1G6GLZ5_9BACT|nr:hypothetical protein SAMN05216323_100247 [Williamwhitmania taraxaci]